MPSKKIGIIKFDQVEQTSKNTMRFSEDGKSALVKFKGETPKFLKNEKQYTQQEMKAILNDPNGEWRINNGAKINAMDRIIYSKINPINWF